MAVTSPKRLPHIRRPAASVTKALGVPRYCFQYASSLGRIFFMSMAKPASQFSVFSALAMPGKSGMSVRSAVGPSIGATARTRKVFVFSSRRCVAPSTK
jgi:hypothetical protein